LNSLLGDFKNDLRDVLMPMIGMEIPLAITKTVEACWAESKRPQLYKKQKTKLGWDFYFNLPAGMCYKEFIAKAEYFRDAIGDVTTECQHIGKMALLKIITNRIADRYEYNYHIPNATKMVLPIPIGYTHNGLLVEDLSKVYNILIGGYVGGGKSNSIHVIVNSLLNIPKPPKIIMIDFKLLEYNYLKNHVLLITDQEGAGQTLSRLLVEMRNRLLILQEAKCVGIDGYNKKYNNSMEYIVLVIDELAELDNKSAQADLETLLRLCRASGIHIILATQRPDSTIFGNKKFGACKANLIGRLCFQVADGVNSKIILDSNEAAALPNIPGRAIWKLGKITEIQTPYLDPEIAEERLYEQPSKGREQGLLDDRDDKRMGCNDNRPNTPITLPICKSRAKEISKTLLSKATEKMRTNKPIQLLCRASKRYFTED